MALPKKSAGESIFNIVNITGMSILCISIIYPFIEMLTNSLSTEADILKSGVKLLPNFSNIYYGNWIDVFNSKMLWVSFGVTVYVTLFSSILQLYLCAAYAYPLSRKYLPNRNFWTIVLLFTMYFSGGLIPTYLLYLSLGMVNTLWALIIGGVGAWNVLIIRNFFMTIPDSLQESAAIDGANEITIFARIILPLSKPVLATVFLWNIVGVWNSWVGCLIYITDPEKQVLQIVLRKLIFERTLNINSMNDVTAQQEILKNMVKQKANTNYGLQAATLLFVTVPILVSYPFLQKYFVKGVLIGSLKG